MMEKLTAAYLRMNQRERMMTLVVVAILFLLINIFAWRLVLGSISNSGRQLAARRSTRVFIERELTSLRGQIVDVLRVRPSKVREVFERLFRIAQRLPPGEGVQEI